MAKPAILLVEDDSSVRHGIAAFLRANGIEVDEAETMHGAIEAFREATHEVVVADYSLPDGTSLEILPHVKRQSEDTPFIILTAHGSIDLAVRAIKEGAEQFLTKPVDSNTLLVLVRRLIEQRHLKRKQALAAREQPDAPNPFLGDSALIRDLETQARRMLEWDSPILILGETGAGKGVLARWIHANGPRADEPFVNVNCAGSPASSSNPSSSATSGEPSRAPSIQSRGCSKSATTASCSSTRSAIWTRPSSRSC